VDIPNITTLAAIAPLVMDSAAMAARVVMLGMSTLRAD